MVPYSPVRIAPSGTFYVSGQLPADCAAAPAQQAASCLAAIEKVLGEQGIGKADILKTALYTTDLSALPDINDAYLDFFQGLPMPARSAFEVRALAQGAAVEIDCYGERGAGATQENVEQKG